MPSWNGDHETVELTFYAFELSDLRARPLTRRTPSVQAQTSSTSILETLRSNSPCPPTLLTRRFTPSACFSLLHRVRSPRLRPQRRSPRRVQDARTPPLPPHSLTQARARRYASTQVRSCMNSFEGHDDGVADPLLVQAPNPPQRSTAARSRFQPSSFLTPFRPLVGPCCPFLLSFSCSSR